VSWPSTQAAYWIGKPSAGSSPVILFLFDAPKSCASLANFNWDKIIGKMRVLEIGLDAATVKAYPIRKGATVAYLQGEYNPDADSGTVTIASATPGKSIAGSFDAMFGGQAIKGSFDAAFCAEGVEP
jgi:hypothetical protein